MNHKKERAADPSTRDFETEVSSIHAQQNVRIMRIAYHSLFVLTLLFFSCSGTKRMANEKAFSFTEEEFPEVLKGAQKLPELMSPKEKAMHLKLNEIYVYHVLVDTIHKEMRLDLSPKVCAKLGLPASAEKILGEAFKEDVENAKKRGEEYFSWYLSNAAKVIAAERLKKGKRGFFLTPVDGGPPQ